MATKIPSGPSPILIEPKSNRDERQKLKPTTAPDRALDPRRSIGSGPEMNKTMPAPRNYGGLGMAQPMPYYPNQGGGGIKTMPYTPPKDGSGPKFENMPYIQPKKIGPGVAMPPKAPVKPTPQGKMQRSKP